MIEELAVQIKNKQKTITELFEGIKVIYDEIFDAFANSNGVKTKEIEKMYADIERNFKIKSAHEADVIKLRRDINKELGI